MSKSFAFIVTYVLIAFTFSACQTANQVRQASQEGLGASYSCEQITSSFAAYEQDKTSLNYLLELSKMTGLELNTGSENFDAASYYTKAKASANLVLLMQGCSPLL